MRRGRDPRFSGCIQVLRTDSTPVAGSMEAVLEVPTEHLVFLISGWVRPSCGEAPHQSRNPVSCLERLIAVAFQMERWLD